MKKKNKSGSGVFFNTDCVRDITLGSSALPPGSADRSMGSLTTWGNSCGVSSGLLLASKASTTREGERQERPETEVRLRLAPPYLYSVLVMAFCYCASSCLLGSSPATLPTPVRYTPFHP